MGIENIAYQDVIVCLVSFAVILLVSPLIGIVFAFSAGLVSRFTNHISVIEPITIFMFGYMSFLLAEMFHLSGILSYVSFCHIVYFSI